MIESRVLEAIADAADVLQEKESEARSARDGRDSLIRQARREGFTLRAIGEAADLHYTAVLKIERGGSR